MVATQESHVSVDGKGSLVYAFRKFVVGIPFLALNLRLPTWLSPLGCGGAKEIGETQDRFRVEVEMTHSIFGRTLACTGMLRFQSPQQPLVRDDLGPLSGDGVFGEGTL